MDGSMPVASGLLCALPMKITTLSIASLALMSTSAPAQTAGGSSGQDSIKAPSVTLKPASNIGYDGRRFGAGLMLGEPTGASLKYWVSDQGAVAAGIGWSLESHDDFHLHADYLYHLFDLISVEQGRLPVYFGGGLRVKFRDHQDDLIGFRAVGGLDYQFRDQPIDIFVEAGPVFDVAPDFEVRFTAAIGARYWF